MKLLAVEDAPADPSFAEIDGLRIRYRSHRRSNSRKILLTNALPMSIRTWDTLWDRLAEEFEILAIDLPGFGLSESRPEILRPSALGNFLEKAIQKFSWEGCLAVGPDIGVPVLLSLAQTRPQILRGIAIGDGPGFYPPALSPDLSLSVRSAAFRRFATLFYEPRIYLKQIFWRARRKNPPAPVAYNEYVRGNSRHAFRNTMAFLSSYPDELRKIGDRLAGMSLPTLLFWGELDRFVPLSNAQTMRDRLPNGTLHVFRGCGHFSHEDAGPGFVDILSEWDKTSCLGVSTAPGPG